MTFVEFWHQLWENIRNASVLEYIAVIAGIASVWFSRRENILLYPVGLINTIFYTYLSFRSQLLGEASVNLYYSVISVYGWWIWSRKDRQSRPVLAITFSTRTQWLYHLGFFLFFYTAIFFALSFLKKAFAPDAIPWADAFASATAYTGMWLMARKKVESWYWWIATNIASIPLYFVKGLALTSVYYLILIFLAVAGLLTWRQKAAKQQ